MKDVTLNPAMGQYLDMVNNHKAGHQVCPNENYGRELMQLFTIGLNNLNMDGHTRMQLQPIHKHRRRDVGGADRLDVCAHRRRRTGSELLLADGGPVQRFAA